MTKDNLKGAIDFLKTSNSFVAQEIVDLQQESYRIEADIIGNSCIPPLFDTVDNIRQTDEVFLGYKVKRELVGLLSYKLEFGILDIHRLAVKPDHFNKGIAKNLLCKVIEDNPEAQKVIVATGAKNRPAIKLYERLGFKIIREFDVEENMKIAQLELMDTANVQACKYRNEDEMLSQILEFANSTSDIRAVLMNGSRVNPNVKPDRFQDYDIVCITENPQKYMENQSWIETLGETLIIQQNDLSIDGIAHSIFLMQFADGNRIDLKFFPIEKIHLREKDTLEKVLLDKDKIIEVLPQPSDRGYYTEKPSKEMLLDRINNILWCSGNIVKGICREEFNYAKRMQEQIIRADLNTLMRWYIADKHDWKINTGVFGKWMQEHLSEDEWSLYLKTCAGGSYDEMWDAMIHMIDMTHLIGIKLTESLECDYPHKDEEGMRKFIRMNMEHR